MRSNDLPHRKALVARWVAPAIALLLLGAAGMYTVVIQFWPHALSRQSGAEVPRPAPSSPPAAVRAAAREERAPGTAAGASTGDSSAASREAVASGGRGAAPEPPPMPAPADTPAARREAIRTAARTYREGRFNVFFREETLIQELNRGGRENITALQQELADPSALAALPADTRFVEGKPEAVLDRMAMIDLLHSLAPEDAAARDAMVSLALEPIDPALSEVAKKSLVGEKYDLFFRLAQLDRQRAVSTFKQLGSDKLKSLLRNALLAGLYESGATTDEVQRLTHHL
ncbi:hypothetical protein JQX13_06115 [Archangium violaceum]|uniref:hypothetical protein n=1 Tax=Archangium violaceum TaxID=83451 RepID=UPI00193BAB23|nr:hypothetical protein [Archangium violaceum]QRK09697.1 hypothetical protein JQX13_06115 [Archangium violaceum]